MLAPNAEVVVVVAGDKNSDEVVVVLDASPNEKLPKAGALVVTDVKLKAGLFSVPVPPKRFFDASPLANENPVLGVVVPNVFPDVVV